MHDKAVMADAIRRFLHPVMEDTEIP